MEQKPKKETWNIYVELQQLLREVYRTLFGMPKKDRVVLGDRIMSAATDALTFYNLAYKFMESRDYYKLLFVREYTKLKELLSFIGSGLKMFRKKLVLNVKKNCFNLKKWRKTWRTSPSRQSTTEGRSASSSCCASSDSAGVISASRGTTCA